VIRYLSFVYSDNQHNPNQTAPRNADPVIETACVATELNKFNEIRVTHAAGDCISAKCPAG